MGIEGLLTAGAALLLLAAGGASGWAWRADSRRSRTLARVARLLAAALLAAALGLGGWPALDLGGIALGLALGATLGHLALAAILGLDNPLADLAALLLTLGAMIGTRPGAPSSGCLYTWPLHRGLWLVLLLGSGGLATAGSGGLLVAVAALAGRDGAWPRRSDLHAWLKGATCLGLASVWLGLGLLALETWWTVGSLTGGDLRLIWLAAAWLLAAMSWQAWQLPRRAARWAAGLAMLAAGVAVAALLILPYLGRGG